MPSAPPVYPLDAIPLETVDRSSDALQLHELASAWTVCQTAARCFVVLLFANGIIGDGHLGIWGALRNVYPQAAEQRCWNHKILNVLDRLPKRQQDQAKLMLRTIPYAQTRTEAERLRTEFTRWCRDHSYEAACVTLERDWDRMITFYDFPKEHWQHLRTTSPVESPFAALRLRTDAAKRYKRVDRAIAVIWKMLMVAEQRFRRLKAPELIEDVYLGAQYVDGIVSETTAEKVAA